MTFISWTKLCKWPTPFPVQVPVDAVSPSLNVKRPFGLLWCVELCASFTRGVGRLVSDALKASCQSGCASLVTVLVLEPRKNDIIPQRCRHIR